MGLKLIISIFAVCMTYQIVTGVAQTKNDPIESEKTCLDEVAKKYNVLPAVVKVVYRGDDSTGNHIVNYVFSELEQEGITGICLVKIADSTVQIKELDIFPNNTSR